jgi:hypothetical protein
MAISWLRSRIQPEARFLRHLEEGRWDKLAPARQQDALTQFITRAAMTPGRDEVLLRFSLGAADDLRYLWAIYEILSADMTQCQFTLRALFVPKEGFELAPPDGYEDTPFFAIDKRSNDQQRKAA